jgi:hypothetical protein
LEIYKKGKNSLGKGWKALMGENAMLKVAITCWPECW